MRPFFWNPPPNPWSNHPLLEGLDVPDRLLPDPAGRADRPGDLPPPAVPGVNPPPALSYPQIGVGEELSKLAKAAGRRGGVKAPRDATASVYEWIRSQAGERARFVGDYLARRRTRRDVAHHFRVTEAKVDEWAAQAKKVIKEEGRLVVPEVKPILPRELVLSRDVTYFASSLGGPGEIWGFLELGRKLRRPIFPGVTVHDCMSIARPPLSAEDRLERYTQCMDAARQLGGVRGKVKLFIDSGAFSEVDEVNGRPRLNKTKEIKRKTRFGKVREPGRPPEDKVILGWEDRLAAYENLAAAIGSGTYVVAPDMVGSQSGTLRRMREYRAEILRIAKRHKANVLAPVQLGRKPMHEFWKEIKKVYGGIRLIPAVPMKKGACSLEELLAFLRKARPSSVHLLGIGPGGSAFRTAARDGKVTALEVLDSVRATVRGIEVSHDSVLLRSGAGRGFLGVGNTDVLSFAQDVAYREVATEAFLRSTKGGKEKSLGVVSLRAWVKGRGWKPKVLPDWEGNLEEENVAWFTPLHRERLLHLVTRFEKSGKGVVGFHMRWRQSGLTKTEKKTLLEYPSVFFGTEATPGTRPGTFREVVSRKTGEARVVVPMWKHILANYLNEEWAHYLAAFFVALKKSEAIKRAWVSGARQRGEAEHQSVESELGAESRAQAAKAADMVLEDEWGKKKVAKKKAEKKVKKVAKKAKPRLPPGPPARFTGMKRKGSRWNTLLPTLEEGTVVVVRDVPGPRTWVKLPGRMDRSAWRAFTADLRRAS